MASKLGVSLCVFFIVLASTDAQYNGKLIGSFPDGAYNNYDISGEVYAVNQNTIRIIGFSYKGGAPDAVIWVGENGEEPSESGFPISSVIENAMLDETLGDLTLPTGKSVSDLNWISVWCRRFNVDLNYFAVPANFASPAEHNIGQLSGLYGLSATSVVIVNDQTFRFEDLQYDGSCPGARFWAGTGSTPSASGHPVRNEHNSDDPLVAYSGANIELILPDGESVFEIGYIGVWCQGADVGHVDIPAQSQLNIPARLLPVPQ